jgi:hypothetical protein
VPPRVRQVLGGRVELEQDVVGRDAVVEAVDELLEEGQAADRLVQRSVVGDRGPP